MTTTHNLQETIVAQAITAFLASNFEAGDLVTHEWIEEQLQIPQIDSRIPSEEVRSAAKRIELRKLSRVEEFRMQLRHVHRIEFASVQGEGYRVLPPRETASYAIKRAHAKMVQQASLAIDIAKHVATERLTASERQVHTDNVARIAMLASMVRKVPELPNGENNAELPPKLAEEPPEDE